MTRTLLKLSEVTEPGWYVNINFITEPEHSYFPETEAGESLICQFDEEGVWRSTTGHGITLEQPDYFTEKDRFLGPFNWSKQNG